MDPTRTDLSRARDTGRALLCALVATLGLGAAASWAEHSPLSTPADIAARSYASETVGSIVGRSAHELTRGAPRRPTPPSMPEADRVLRFHDSIERHSARQGIDASLVKAIIYAESGGDPDAVSPRGAAGLMQLMPETAQQLGVRNVLDPEENIASGTKYLKQMLDRYHSVAVALWAYNAGPGAVADGKLPQETEDYVARVMRLRRHFSPDAEER